MSASPAHRAWLTNIDRHAVAPQAVADIVRRRHITRDSFRILDAMEQISDPDGKSYFVIPRGTGAGDARRAALLTYILNAGTGYGCARSDFPETPYGAAEVQRIVERQWANRWSYEAVRRVCNTGGLLAATPNGILMGLGGNRIHAQLSRRGGTTWGDLFMVSINQVTDPAGRMRAIIESGRAYPAGPGLDRLLHHEEIHAQQWAGLGPLQLPARYLAEETRVRIFGGTNRFEKQAGLSDGGYR
ncbi:hypothetical protein [[Mycobacterium] crassicus]|uniref:Uncharacterized protein n=1 Tax=[Mycobacterium] crassicus TaxID=2872309 RepID=A0ABU5XF77_9MYCO|nr:hypothetical protein [Mycolicibacter sp. MYC098]MEB3020624.1 hypothetical protein [Mycolicibacter sp. MYC098]